MQEQQFKQITMEELDGAISRIKLGTATGLDAITQEMRQVQGKQGKSIRKNKEIWIYCVDLDDAFETIRREDVLKTLHRKRDD